ncbi:MAG: hypothetical protein DRP09_20390 [Candidatus Thorarchaeota archaeon]|nr:MAG: hypothetical protein DRP09_20390 [Candidatus Thorarchaeota archaeon]
MVKKKFKRGISYLKKVKYVSTKESVYLCLICLSKTRIYDKRVSTGHTKTCGCVSGRKPLPFEINRDGSITSLGGYDLTSKKGLGYRGFRSTHYVHRLVAEKFIPNPQGLGDINHKNGDKQDNRVENLEWCSRSHNLKHAIRTGLKKYKEGRISTRRTLTNEQASFIKRSKLGCTTLAKNMGISKRVILDIRHNKTYKEI